MMDYSYLAQLILSMSSGVAMGGVIIGTLRTEVKNLRKTVDNLSDKVDSHISYHLNKGK